MRLTRMLLATTLGATIMLTPHLADAGPNDIVAEAGEEGDRTDPDGTTWSCEWHDVHVFGNVREEQGDELIFHIDGMRWRINTATGEFWQWAYQTCTSSEGDTDNGHRWRLLSDPDPVVVIDPAYDRVVEQVDAPTPRLSPVGPGYVNLGMWLATEQQPPVVARAVAGSSWAEVTATLETTAFDMGVSNDAGHPVVIECDGAGVPIPDSAKDSLDESPDCGYTYRQAATNGQITITATWEVTYVLSDGRTGSRDPIVLSTAVPYEVLEIQTVGVDS